MTDFVFVDRERLPLPTPAAIDVAATAAGRGWALSNAKAGRKIVPRLEIPVDMNAGRVCCEHDLGRARDGFAGESSITNVMNGTSGTMITLLREEADTRAVGM